MCVNHVSIAGHVATGARAHLALVTTVVIMYVRIKVMDEGTSPLGVIVIRPHLCNYLLFEQSIEPFVNGLLLFSFGCNVVLESQEDALQNYKMALRS